MSLATSVILFAYFGLTGYPVVSALNTRRDLVRNVLIAPAVGLALAVYCSYVASRLGFPIVACARPIAALCVIMGAGLLVWRPPVVPFKHLIPYAPLAALAFVTAGWPLLIPGTAWLGSNNVDFTNYVLDAERLADSGYLQPSDPDVWQRQSDWATYFIIFAAVGARTGAELLLSATMTVIGKTAVETYMPLIVAMHVSVVTAAAGLINAPGRYARVAAAAALSLAAMLALGVVLQLLAQVLGLALLALACALCLTRFWRLGRRALRRWIALAAMVFAAFVLSYPEAVPFFAAAFVLHHVLDSQLRRHARALVVPVTAVAIVAGALIAPDLVGLAGYLINQFRFSTGILQHARLFPYFLVPSGLAALFGLVSYSPHDFFGLPGAVAVGVLLAVGCAAATVWQVWRREPPAAVVAVMMVLGWILFARNVGFGLFKLAMYAQPFLIPTVAVSVCRVVGVAK